MKQCMPAILLILFTFPETVPGKEPVLKEHLLATMSPPWDVAAYRFEDLNDDNTNELFVVGTQGQIQTWSGTAISKNGYVEVGDNWSLPSPRQSLLSLSGFFSRDESKSLITLTPDGLWVYAVSTDGSIESKGILVNRRMKLLFRLDQPVFSNFLQDINQDDQLDVLVPLRSECEIWINQGLEHKDSPVPRFMKMGKFPVKMTHRRTTDLRNTTEKLSEHFSIPSLRLKDINNDGHLDLVVSHELKRDYYLLEKGGAIPHQPTVSLDLSLYHDTTPKAEGMKLGEIVTLSDDPQLIESDLNNDNIADYVIWHRRKLWFFHGSPQGPQFMNPSSIIKTAEDITHFMPCALDEDDCPDLLMVRIHMPTVAKMLRGLFSDWDIKFESIGYQSNQGQSFALSSSWKGEAFLRLPAILSLVTNPEAMKEFEIDPKYGSSLSGDFNGDGVSDVAMSNTKTNRFELWFGEEGDPEMTQSKKDDDKETAAKIRKLLFSQSDNVWDLHRIIKAVNALMDKQILTVTGGKDPDFHLALCKDVKQVRGLSVDYNHDETDELLIVSSDLQAEHRKTFTLYTITKQ
jgi:hypothetical protein